MYQLMKKLGLVILLFITILVLFFFLSAVENLSVLANEPLLLSESAQAGKEIFDEVNCLMCHMLNGEGGGLDEDAPDLAGVSSRKKPEEIKQWLKGHLYEEPRLSMFEEDPSDQDISNLTDYLETL